MISSATFSARRRLVTATASRELGGKSLLSVLRRCGQFLGQRGHALVVKLPGSVEIVPPLVAFGNHGLDLLIAVAHRGRDLLHVDSALFLPLRFCHSPLAFGAGAKLLVLTSQGVVRRIVTELVFAVGAAQSIEGDPESFRFVQRRLSPGIEPLPSDTFRVDLLLQTGPQQGVGLLLKVELTHLFPEPIPFPSGLLECAPELLELGGERRNHLR